MSFVYMAFVSFFSYLFYQIGGRVKIKRKFIKTSLFEKNMDVSTMDDIYGKYTYKRWQKRFMIYLFCIGILLIVTVIVS